MANLGGFLPIKTNALSPKRDNIIVRFARFL